MSDAQSPESSQTDRFELATALLLGLAAVGAAVASLQSGQWGGKQLEAFAEANTLTTKASTQYTEDTVMMNADYSAVALAKQHILEARDARHDPDYERHMDFASYVYTSQLSQAAYTAMELPAGYWEEDEEADGGTSSGTEAAEEETDETAADEDEALVRDIPDEDLFASLAVELDDDYVDVMLAEGTKIFEQADTRFAEGRVANENGDSFDLIGVFYTIALFFAGLGLVFKTRVRWILFFVGLAVFVLSTFSLLGLPWA